MKRIYLVLFLLAFTLFSALSTGFYLLFRLLYVLALIMIGSYIWAWINSRGIAARVERRISRAEVGDIIEERITLLNTNLIAKSWLEVQEMTDMPGRSSVTAISLPSRGFRSWRESIACRRRGIYNLGPLKVTSSDIFGIFRKERYYGDVETIIVYPRIVELPFFNIPAAELPGEGRALHRSQFITTNASTIRDYTHGDSLSRIHWPSTARMGKLMTKEFDQGPSSNIWLFLDLHRGVQAEQEDGSTDDYGATIAASLAKKYLDQELPVGFIAYGDEKYLVLPETGSAQMARIMDLLAKSKAEGNMPLVKALPEEEALYSRHSSLVIITSSYGQDWLPVLGELMRRRMKVVVILVEPSTFGGTHSSLPVLEGLASSGIPAYIVNKGDDVSVALSRIYEGSEASLVATLERESLL